MLGPTSKARWSYACSKMVDEFLALAYHREKKLPATIVRLLNLVGSRQTGRYGMVLPNFVQQALGGMPLTVLVSESKAVVLHMSRISLGIGPMRYARKYGWRRYFNLGGTEEVSMNALADMVIVGTQSKSIIKHIPYEEAYGPGFEDMERRVPDISKAGEWFGYKPTHSLVDIVTSVIDYHRDKA